MLNKDNSLQKRILSLVDTGIILTSTHLEEPLMIINKNFKFPLKEKTLNAYSGEKIKLMISKDNSKIPQSFPFFLINSKNGPVPIVVLDSYGKFEEDGSFKIPAKTLYTLMEAGYILGELYSIINISSTSSLQKLSNNWANMVLKVFNKKYSLNLDKEKTIKVRFLLNKFYLKNILGMDNEDQIYNISATNCVGGVAAILEDLNSRVDNKAYEDINSFINLLCEDELMFGFKDLNTRAFLEAFIAMYKPTNLLSLESLPHFLFNIFAANKGAFINNQYALMDIIDNNVDKAYVSLA